MNILNHFMKGWFVRYPSVSLSLTLSRNEKVEQHIRKKTHKPNVLRFWVEGGVIPLCGFGSILILVRSPQFCPLEWPNKWYQSRWFAAWTSTVWPLYRKSSWRRFSGKRVPYKCVNGGTSGSLWGTRVWGECTNVEGTLTWRVDLLGI